MSENLSTQNIPKAGGGVKKTLEPGNQICTILSIELKPFTIISGAYEIQLNLLGKELGSDFQGFFLDVTNESLGRHTGQVGRVKAGLWAFADGETKSKVKISRNDEILKWVNSLCEAIGKKDWIDAQDKKHPNIESFMEAFNKDKPFKDLKINFCIAGKEYMNKEYLNYDLYLPKFTKAGAPFELANVVKSKVVLFDEKIHITRKKVEIVTEFAPTEDTSTNNDIISEIKDDFVL